MGRQEYTLLLRRFDTSTADAQTARPSILEEMKEFVD
jgi:hypothetical protein